MSKINPRVTLYDATRAPFEFENLEAAARALPLPRWRWLLAEHIHALNIIVRDDCGDRIPDEAIFEAASRLYGSRANTVTRSATGLSREFTASTAAPTFATPRQQTSAAPRTA